MIYGLYQSAAGMMTQEYRQDVIANNLANAETVGFKRDIATVAERMRADRAGERSGPSDKPLDNLTGGVWLGRTATDFTEAPFQRTGNATDVAIVGAGFLRFAVAGRELLSRDGRLTTDADGTLVSVTDGAPALSASGHPIRTNPRGGAISIDASGEVQQNGVVIGRIGLVDVPNHAGLRKVGNGRFLAEGQTATGSPALLQSGHVEPSGVQPIFELTGMLEASRAYQFNAQMITLQDQTAARLINVVASA